MKHKNPRYPGISLIPQNGPDPNPLLNPHSEWNDEWGEKNWL
jgi:hypothetical protein